MTTNASRDDLLDLPVMPPNDLLALAVAVLVGALGAAVALPAWLPDLSASLLGAEPKVYWHLSRAAGFVAFALLGLSMALGLSITNKLARLWPGGPVAFDLHQHTSLLGLVVSLFHGLILLGDRYASYTPLQLLVPFAAGSYRPFAVGLGQIAFYLFAVVALSFYARKRIGPRRWRAIHVLSFLVLVFALIHGGAAGTDSGAPAARALYWTSAGSLLFLIVYRVLVRKSGPAETRGATSVPVVRPDGH